MNYEVEQAIDSFPEVKPWLARIGAAEDESKILQVVVESMNDEDLLKIGGLFYSGYASCIGFAAAERTKGLAIVAAARLSTRPDICRSPEVAWDAHRLIERLRSIIAQHGPDIKVGIRDWECGSVNEIREAEVWYRADDKQSPDDDLGPVYIALDGNPCCSGKPPR
jgi:hypothetical protein